MYDQIVLRKEYLFSDEELDWKTLVKAVLIKNGVAGVLAVSEQEYGKYYFWIFADICTREILEDREKFLEFINRNQCNGYSEGAFDSIDELNRQLEKDGATGYGKVQEF